MFWGLRMEAIVDVFGKRSRAFMKGPSLIYHIFDDFGVQELGFITGFFCTWLSLASNSVLPRIGNWEKTGPRNRHRMERGKVRIREPTFNNSKIMRKRKDREPTRWKL